MKNFEINNFNKNCLICGNLLNGSLTCRNPNCRTHEFLWGDRVFVFSRPELGYGFIDKIEEFKTAYEFCIDEKEIDESEINEIIEHDIDKNDNFEADKLNEIKLFKTLNYRVKFKTYFYKNFSKEELRHDIFEPNKEVKTIYGIGIIEKINVNSKDKKISYDIRFQDNNLKNVKENEIIEYVKDPIEDFGSKTKFYFDEYNQNLNIFLINYFAEYLHSIYISNKIKFISNSRLEYMLHQLYVAKQLIMRYMPRCILADEVGLGKTIEAGIFIKEMIARNLIKKILIIVPANLVSQWIFEFENKFSIKLERFDSKFLKNLDRCSHPNIFYRVDTEKEYPYIITSLQFARSPKIREILAEIYWDCVIFDEAHHLRRYLIQNTGKYKETLNYKLARKLSEKCNSLLLLTATPIQLHSFDLFSLLQLLRPDIFNNYSEFEEDRKKIPLINTLIKNLKEFSNLNIFQQKNIASQIEEIFSKPPLIYRNISKFYKEKLNMLNSKSYNFNDDDINKIIKEIMKKELNLILKTDRNIDFENFSHYDIENLLKTKTGRILLIKNLQKYHFLNEFLFRNRKRIVFADKSNKRIVNTIAIKLTEEEESVYQQIKNYLARIYNQSLEKNQNAIGFLVVILQKLLTSSQFAFIKSLENRIQNIKTKLSFLNSKKLNEFKYDIDEDFSEILEDSENNYSIDIDDVDFLTEQINILNNFIERLKSLKIDSKLENLKILLKNILPIENLNNKNEKVIIFTQFKHTMEYLRSELSKIGYKIDVFHGSLDNNQKNEAIEHFKNQGDILISTEAGGEGRNFQFCNIIINYDLPWNPMKLEQRIGRIDRIGQKKDIFIYNFTTLNTIEHRILDVLIKRINLFQESIGDLEPIVNNIEKIVQNTILSQKNIIETINEFEDQLKKNEEKAVIIQNQLDDFILDKKSFSFKQTIEDLKEISKLVNSIDIISFVNKIFNSNSMFSYLLQNNLRQPKINKVGTLITQKEVSQGKEFLIYKIHIEDWFRFMYNLEKNDYVGVFDLEIAKKNESLDFFSIGHPLINSFIEFAKSPLIETPSIPLIISIENNKSIDSIIREFYEYINKKELKNIEINFHTIINDLKCLLDCIKYQNNKLIWILIFQIEILGIIFEKINVPIICITDKINHQSQILTNLSEIFKQPIYLTWFLEFFSLKNDKRNLNSIYSKYLNLIKNFSTDHINSIIKFGENYIKDSLISKINELKILNENMFRQEFQNLILIYEYKKEYLKQKINNSEERLKYLEASMPTKRQWDYLIKITDPIKKRKKEDEFNSIINKYHSLNKEIDELKEKLESLEFDLQADIKRLIFYRTLKKRISVKSIGIFILED